MHRDHGSLINMTSVVYPPRAAPALGYLNSGRNDIEIFVEDRSSPNLWIKLLRKFLPTGTKLNDVNILGTRENVLAACRADQADDGRKKLYIIDADLDLLKGKAKPKLKHLYRLRAYCVENYLINDDSLIELATSFDTDVSRQDAGNQLDYSGWLSRNEQILNSLFVCYAVTHTLDDSHKTVGFPVHRLLDEAGRFELCRLKTGKRVFALYRAMIAVRSTQTVRDEYARIKSNASKLDVSRSVSAKDYILPQVHCLMKDSFGMNISIKQFKVMLASLADKNIDRYLVRRLNKLSS